MSSNKKAWKIFLLLAGLPFSSLTVASQSCHPLSIDTCSLPFPSNFYTQSDSNNSTGKVLDLKGGLLSAAVEKNIANLSSTDSFHLATGFSAASPVMIELS